MISTKGRYSIRILLDLAEHRSGGYIPMKEVAARQNISLKYIEKLMPALKTAGFIESVHGIGGGYRLAREPETCTLWDILQCFRGEPGPGKLPEGRGWSLRPVRRVPYPPGVGGILPDDPGLFFRCHSGGPDGHPPGGQLRHLNIRRPDRNCPSRPGRRIYIFRVRRKKRLQNGREFDIISG